MAYKSLSELERENRMLRAKQEVLKDFKERNLKRKELLRQNRELRYGKSIKTARKISGFLGSVGSKAGKLVQQAGQNYNKNTNNAPVVKLRTKKKKRTNPRRTRRKVRRSSAPRRTRPVQRRSSMVAFEVP